MDVPFKPTRKVILKRDLHFKGLGFPDSVLFRMIKNGEFPKPFHLTARKIGWLEEDLDRWIDKRIAASEAA